MRLNKYLANLGIASRRAVVGNIKNGDVEVNGLVVTAPGAEVDPQRDQILFKGKRIEQPKLTYFMLNKPVGVVSTVSDELGRKTVTTLIKNKQRLYPIGRLDQDTSGLIILTNDGELTNKLTHPKFHTPKTYQLLVQGQPSGLMLQKLANGVKLKEGITAKAKIKVLKNLAHASVLEITLFEGKNRQIRRMCGVVGIQLLKLKRIAIGDLQLGDLKEGGYRELSSREVEQLKNSLDKI